MIRAKRLQAKTPFGRVKPLTAKTGLKPGAGLKRNAPMRRNGPGTTAKRSPARRGSMTAAVALVLAGEATVAQAARECEVDAERLEAAAGKTFRAAVMERDDWTCRHCGAMAAEVQHIIARGMGGTADPTVAFGLANGVGLCRDSHLKAESRDPEMYALGFWRKQGETAGAAPIYAAAEYGRERLWLLPDGTTSRTNPRELAA